MARRGLAGRPPAGGGRLLPGLIFSPPDDPTISPPVVRNNAGACLDGIEGTKLVDFWRVIIG